MSTVIEMISTIALDESEKAEVLACDQRIAGNVLPLRKVSMEIGRDGAYIESLAEKGSYQLLGYKHQHEYRIAKGIGRSNWYRVVGVAKLFLEIDRDIYTAMSLENAERLSVEPPPVRFNPDNLRDAAEMTATEFDDHMTTLGAHREGKPKNERWVEVKWRMRAEQRKVIETALKAWKEEHGIEDDAFALETLVMEYADRPTLAGFILQSIPRLTGTLRDATEIGTLKQAVMEHLQEMANIVRVCCGEIEEEQSA